MRSLGKGKLSAAYTFEQSVDAMRDTPAASWFSWAVAHADQAARAGFVLSMAFLATAAIYALSLSGPARLVFSDLSNLADRAVFDAGFRLEDLALSGAKNTPRAALLAALDLPYKKSSLFYDTAQAHDRLLALGWIEAAEVRRILPSRLEVVISERAPFARWEDQANTVQVIDRKGHILGPDQEGQFSALPLFSGQGAPEEAAGFEDAISGDDSLKRRIGRAELLAGRFWLIRLDNGLMLKLPRKVNSLVLGRLDSLLTSAKIAVMGLETIDLRLSNRTILQLRDPTIANRDRAVGLLTSLQAQVPSMPRKGKAL